MLEVDNHDACRAKTSENSTNIGSAPNTEKDDNKSFPATQRKWLTAARNARQSRKFLFRRSFWRRRLCSRARGGDGYAAALEPKGCTSGSFSPLYGREVGGGRIRRQPGQVRKEAALTIRSRVVRQPLICRSRAIGIAGDPALDPFGLSPVIRGGLGASRLAPSPFRRKSATPG